MSKEKLTLGRAMVKLAKLIDDPSILEDPLYILRAGAQGLIPIYWRNSDQIWTRLSDFTGELRDTDSASRWMRLYPNDVSLLETSQQTDVIHFYLTDRDLAMLPPLPPIKKVKGTTVVVGEPGFRHSLSGAAVTINRDQIFVIDEDLQALADTFTTALPTKKSPAPAIDQEKSGKERRSRKPSWHMISMPYMKQLYKDGSYQSASVFYKALLNKAGTEGSPFTNVKSVLFCPNAGTSVEVGTLGTKWAEIRGMN
jgi:hypothetical protein